MTVGELTFIALLLIWSIAFIYAYAGMLEIEHPFITSCLFVLGAVIIVVSTIYILQLDIWGVKLF